MDRPIVPDMHASPFFLAFGGLCARIVCVLCEGLATQHGAADASIVCVVWRDLEGLLAGEALSMQSLLYTWVCWPRSCVATLAAAVLIPTTLPVHSHTTTCPCQHTMRPWQAVLSLSCGRYDPWVAGSSTLGGIAPPGANAPAAFCGLCSGTGGPACSRLCEFAC
jgi:hypothetical protein